MPEREQRAMTQAERDRLARETHERVRKIEVMLTGNGSPEKGVLWRLAAVERTSKLWRHVALLFMGGFISAAGLWTFSRLTAPAQASPARVEAETP